MRRALVSSACTLVACLILLSLLPASARAAWPHDSGAAGLPLTTRDMDAHLPCSASDGAGGVFTAWRDLNYGYVYVQHVDASGTPLWGGGAGVPISALDGAPTAIVPDGAGGFVCAWHTLASGSNDVYVQRVNVSGVRQWTAGGVVVCNAANDQNNTALAADGSGGAFLAWEDRRVSESSTDVYAQHVNSSGAATLGANGLLVCNAAGMQTLVSVASDGQGGAYIAWQDGRGSARAVYAQRLDYNGAPAWAANGIAVAPGVTADEWNPVMISDGHLGAFVAWNDWRSGNSDVFVQRLNLSGTTLWTANGVQLVNVAGDQTNPALVSDGAGGAIVAWVDGRGTSQDVYAQRVNGLGVTLWTANGVALCTAGGTQYAIDLVPDGSGGAIAAWRDHRNGTDDDVYAQHVAAGGTATWTADGVALCTTADIQTDLTLVSDGAGGAIATYCCQASGSFFHLRNYGQLVDRFGVLGGAPPSIVSVRDVPNDQGGYVSIRWAPSWLDQVPSDPIQYYWIYRQVPQAAAEAALRSGAHLLAAGEGPRAGERALRATVQGTQTYYWEQVVSWGAQGLDGYSAVVATRGDSVAGSNPRTVFMVEARYAGVPGEYWDSAPDSGYSVDNLPPVAPAPFTGSYRAGTTAMQWGANPEPDVAAYRLYRGPSAGFVPGAGNLLATCTSTGYVDSPGAPYVYKLSAVDVHGNEGPCATLVPAGTTAVGPPAPGELALAPPAPNPALTRTRIAYTLPRDAAVRLGLYDAAGRLVRRIAWGAQAAGDHRLALELRDDAGQALPAGLYLLRLDVPGRTLVRRLALVR